MPSYASGATTCSGSLSSDSFMLASEGLDHAKCFVVASGGILAEVYGHCGPGACLSDGQMEAEVPTQGGCGDALPWRP